MQMVYCFDLPACRAYPIKSKSALNDIESPQLPSEIRIAMSAS